jgi:hypothetical protein
MLERLPLRSKLVRRVAVLSEGASAALRMAMLRLMAGVSATASSTVESAPTASIARPLPLGVEGPGSEGGGICRRSCEADAVAEDDLSDEVEAAGSARFLPFASAAVAFGWDEVALEVDAFGGIELAFGCEDIALGGAAFFVGRGWTVPGGGGR